MEKVLNILDFGFFKPPRMQAHQVINSLFHEISEYEQLGFTRYWMSEHFSFEFAWFTPEILMPLLAGYSSKIKIGWTGVLLNYHSPVLIANNMKLLAAIFDDRIDVGFSGSTIAEDYHKYLQLSKEPFIDLLNKTVHLIRKKHNDNKGDNVVVPPHGTSLPSLWYLGVSARSYTVPIEIEANYALSFMHPGSSLKDNVDTIKRYKEQFYEKYGYIPKTNVLVSTHCTNDSRIAKVLDKNYNLNGISNFYGSSDYIVEQLHNMQALLENSEFLLHNPYCDRGVRMESYSRIMEKYILAN
jgi:alkanesulfonate monooxygenase SsuD/methylene tetrahydromethanopterin reductase-like flavin-dependent oxidoreductase (luciferase family)